MPRPFLPLAILALGVTGTLIHAAGPSSGPIGGIAWSYRAEPEPRRLDPQPLQQPPRFRA